MDVQGVVEAEPGFVEVIDGGRGVGICSTTRHSQPAIAATSDPEAFFLGRKLLRESRQRLAVKEKGPFRLTAGMRAA